MLVNFKGTFFLEVHKVSLQNCKIRRKLPWVWSLDDTMCLNLPQRRQADCFVFTWINVHTRVSDEPFTKKKSNVNWGRQDSSSMKIGISFSIYSQGGSVQRQEYLQYILYIAFHLWWGSCSWLETAPGLLSSHTYDHTYIYFQSQQYQIHKKMVYSLFTTRNVCN